MPRTKKEIITISNEQLSVFDYSSLSEPQIRKSLEIKGLMISYGKTVSNGLLELANLAKEQHNNLSSYPLFIDWCKKELGYSEPMANRFLRVGKSQLSNSTVKSLPNGLSGLDAIATALLKAGSEEAKEQISQTINNATEEKGKPLTEAEIKDLLNKETNKLSKEIGENIAKFKKFLMDNWELAQTFNLGNLSIEFKLPTEVIAQTLDNFRVEKANIDSF